MYLKLQPRVPEDIWLIPDLLLSLISSFTEFVFNFVVVTVCYQLNFVFVKMF
jgi:hypothetical protein